MKNSSLSITAIFAQTNNKIQQPPDKTNITVFLHVSAGNVSEFFILQNSLFFQISIANVIEREEKSNNLLKFFLARIQPPLNSMTGLTK